MIPYIIYFIVSIFLEFIIIILSTFNVKIRKNYYNSYKQFFDLFNNLKNAQGKKIILLHAASTGEFEQLQPILKQIDRKKYFIVQSFTSPTIYEINHSESLFDYKCYHPFDIFWISYMFFKILKPEKYIITRHDLWPGHILNARKFKIPIYYINANVHKNSIWYNKNFNFFSKYFLEKINYVIVPSQYLYNCIKEISKNINVMIIQDTRYIQVFDKSKKIPKNTFNILSQIYNENIQDSIMVCGSIDSSDSLILRNLNQILKYKKLIFVPHEVNKTYIKKIENVLNNQNINYLKYSQLISDSDKKNQTLKKVPSLLLVDIIGVLPYLYSFGTTAYIGGGFGRGVHSVLEPAVFGSKIICGPNIEMLDEAKEFKNKGFLHVVNQIGELINLINHKNQFKFFFDSYLTNKNAMNKFIFETSS